MPLDGTTPLWIAARALLAERGEDFFLHRDRALKTSDPEDIHDLRVASRRLREGLTLFAPCYPAENIKRLVRRVKRVTRLLGEIRNTDEAILFFTELAEETGSCYRKEMEGILASFWGKRKKELKGLKTGLKEIAPGSLHEPYRRVINSPSLFTPRENDIDLFISLSRFAGDALDARLADVLKLLPEAREPGNVETQHLLRIAVKHFRYRMEILSFLFGEGYDEMHETLKKYQDVLGKMHDLDVFADIVRDSLFSLQTEKSFLDSILAKREGYFADFADLVETSALEKIGELIRSNFCKEKDSQP